MPSHDLPGTGAVEPARDSGPDSESWTRRGWLAASAGVLACDPGGLPVGDLAAQEPGGGVPRFRYCLNTSTVRGQELELTELARLGAEAGYDAIEPWLPDLVRFRDGGGDLADLGKQIADLGLTIESAIGFAPWIVDDGELRRRGLEQARREMSLLREVGGIRIAAPPVGAHRGPEIELATAAERYANLLEIGQSCGVVPQLEVWGFSTTLSRLSEAAHVAVAAGHPQACLLTDVYHLRRGGSDVTGLRMIRPAAMPVVHLNDYPPVDDRTKLTDADRVYPGDGTAPLSEFLQSVSAVGETTVLSLELFHPGYWKQPALDVMRTGLNKMKLAVARAMPNVAPGN